MCIEYLSTQEMFASLSSQGYDTIDYKCNRAVIFKSSLFHVSEPFVFAPGYQHKRLNLTLLFGERRDDEDEAETGAGGGADDAPPQDEAWDLF